MNTDTITRLHPCAVPPTGNLGVGVFWKCSECGTEWGIRECIGDYGNFFDWRRREGNRYIGTFNPDRFPTVRQKGEKLNK